MKTGWNGGIYIPVTKTEIAKCEFCGNEFERYCWTKRLRTKFCGQELCNQKRSLMKRMEREKPAGFENVHSHCNEDQIKKDYKGT